MNDARPPDTPPAIAETHISWVMLAGDRAYKRLKPVTMPFIDQADRSTRLSAVTAELELNRRIAPDVYLGTSDVLEHGELVDRLLVMRRLPADRRLSALVADPGFDDCLRSVARAIAAFHAGLDPLLDAPVARRDALRTRWQENLDVIRPHVGSLIDRAEFDRVEQLTNQYLDGAEALLDSRIRDGFVRDGHGDLIADDIYCLDDGPRIIDCLEFRDDWRIGDVLSDIGFLVMDIHRLAGSDAALRLMECYREFSNERHPPSLAHHYVAYRAGVRAKVACLRHTQQDPASASLARTYHRLALDHLERARVRVILVGGGPGTGKSTLANALGDRYGYPTLSSDEIRKDLTATPRDEHRFSEPGTGIYDAETTDCAYAEQRREARTLLRAGHGVVLDASWTSERHRRAARELAAECGAELVEIECQLDAAVARERIARRLASPFTMSDATPDLVDYMAEHWEPWPAALTVSTHQPADQVVAEVARVIEGRTAA